MTRDQASPGRERASFATHSALRFRLPQLYRVVGRPRTASAAAGERGRAVTGAAEQHFTERLSFHGSNAGQGDGGERTAVKHLRSHTIDDPGSHVRRHARNQDLGS
jgi:hypothetical protein